MILKFVHTIIQRRVIGFSLFYFQEGTDSELTNLNDVTRDAKKLANDYVHEVYELLKKRNSDETEFLQATREIFDSLRPVFSMHPEYISNGILERLTEPDRIITFRVAWEDDQGKVHVNRGYRVQFNSDLRSI